MSSALAAVALASAVGGSIQPSQAQAPADAPTPAPAPTEAPTGIYLGSLVFFDHCAACHGTAATGTRLAPDLLARVAAMSRADFARVLENGYPGIENGPAPWAGIPDVDRYAAELWAYLDGRARGTVAPGELAPIR